MNKFSLAAVVLIASAPLAQAVTLDGLDDNNDGRISVGEWLQLGPEMNREQFYIIDTNNDLVIDADEFNAQTNDAGLLAS